ncbi:MAG: hypothetical protein II333_02765, partial [Clostridia bacterium]|nr:hypothetical protein [Clostridia bacterium]
MKLPFELVEPTRFLPARTGYRNKIGLHYDKNARRFGYVSRDSYEILPFEDCLLCGVRVVELHHEVLAEVVVGRHTPIGLER